jgi:predicted RNA binding protein YcfA (HicA-like mRNA interferase family)
VSGQLPAITGKQLIRLLEQDGWIRGRKSLHGITFRKPHPDGVTHVTTVPDKRSPLPDGTLNAILGPKQTGIGRDRLGEMIQRHGLR